MDLYWRDLLTAPTEQEYLDMVSNSKWAYLCLLRSFQLMCLCLETGGLFRLAVKLMQAESKTGL